MKALMFDDSLAFVTDAPVPRREAEALVQVICAGICNTDLEIVKGYAGFKGILGHEFVGRVIESPVSGQVGKRVAGEINAGCGKCDWCAALDTRHCRARTVLGIKDRDGAFAEFLSLPPRNLIEVPDSVPDEVAVFIEPLAAALNVLEQVKIVAPSEVAVIGDGKLAQLIIRVIAQTGCNLSVFGKHEQKLDLARSLGARCYRVEHPEDKLLKSEKQPSASSLQRSFDVVIEASGSPGGVSLAVSLVKPRGVIVLKSTHHNPTSLDLSQVVVNEIRIVGSRCGRFRPAIDLLAKGSLDVRQLITAELPIEDGISAFSRASAPETMKVILRLR